MQTDVAETIFDLVKVLPETKQRKVLDFVSDLQNEDNSDLLEMLTAIETRGKTIPDEIWQEIPPDGSVNHDHYLYGAKKK
jgi:hypothetical protein